LGDVEAVNSGQKVHSWVEWRMNQSEAQIGEEREEKVEA